MMAIRVRRTRAPDVVESSSGRVRRIRPVSGEEGPSVTVDKGRLRRTRQAAPEAPRVRRTRPSTVRGEGYISNDPRPMYVIDWTWNWSQKFQLYLMTSFLYYRLNRSLIKDHEYDRLCFELLEGWDTNYHPHKKHVTRADLEAGTGYAIKYPTIVEQAAYLMLERHKEL